MNPAHTRLLVVDDMPTMRKLVIMSCKKVGFVDFLEGKDGSDAYQVLAAASPPVGMILCDWMMPNSNGIDFLKRVRSEERFKNIPFILLTAEAEASQVKEAFALGVTDYIVKPFSVEVLQEKLKKMADKNT